jgi:SAM-dependent methyltransferase
MVEYYRDGSYFEGSACGYTSYREQEESLRLTFRRLLKVLARKGLTGGSVLEVGCGLGFFLDEAQAFFRYRVGTDLSAFAAGKASELADRVWVGGAEALPEEERFDLVVALHVIEHVYDPVSFAKQLASRVKPGGHLLLATPDAGSFWLRGLGKRWPSFKFPEHVVFYDRRVLNDLLREAGTEDPAPISYLHAFPISEVLRKVGLPAGKLTGRWSAWIPATTVASVGRVKG